MFFNLVFKPKIKILLIVFLIILFIINIISFVYLKKLESKVDGKTIKLNLNDIKSYIASYDMTVISNKNIHTYRVSEKCNIKTNHTILEYLDYMKNCVIIELKNNSCIITNSGNMLGLNSQITNNNKNISSISTFIYIYNKINGKCACKKEAYLNNNEIKITLNICNNNNCVIKNIVDIKEISKLDLNLKDNVPLTYIIYDKNKKEYISILYNIFKINEFEG